MEIMPFRYICKNCNKEFVTLQQRKGRQWGLFCSSKCYHIWRKQHWQPTEKQLQALELGRKVGARPSIWAEKHWKWKGGNHRATWKRIILRKFNFTCQMCGKSVKSYRGKGQGKKGFTIEAHHIKSPILYPELRFDPNNGIALCYQCHKKLHFQALALASQQITEQLLKSLSK